jgi:hypothetical protein
LRQSVTRSKQACTSRRGGRRFRPTHRANWVRRRNQPHGIIRRTSIFHKRLEGHEHARRSISTVYGISPARADSRSRRVGEIPDFLPRFPGVSSCNAPFAATPLDWKSPPCQGLSNHPIFSFR